ncbi:MAG TPA: DUF4097 domain-containing protein [Bacillales bacterium]|nr:DUF4097 domain-containing protein [Bacillales bacterium]
MLKKAIGLLFIIIGAFIILGMVGHKGVNWWTSNHHNLQNQSMILRGIATIEIEATGTQVNIISEDRGKLMADLHGDGNGRANLDFQRNGDHLEIQVDQNWFHWFSFGDGLILDVYVPENYNKAMAVDLGSGDLDIQGPSKKEMMNLNSFALDMSSGNADLENLRLDQLKMDGSSGNIDLRWVTANEASLDISSGNIDLEHYSGSLDAELSSGRLNAKFEQIMGPVDIEASSGMISLDLPDEANFALEAKVSSGWIDCEIPLQNKSVEEDRNEVRGSHGSGKYKIELDSSSGVIHIY